MNLMAKGGPSQRFRKLNNRGLCAFSCFCLRKFKFKSNFEAPKESRGDMRGIGMIANKRDHRDEKEGERDLKKRNVEELREEEVLVVE